MRRRDGGPLATAVSYAVLIALGLIVLFPFYWMTITSFKSEDQMRSLTSMFWPSPFIGDIYGQLVSMCVLFSC